MWCIHNCYCISPAQSNLSPNFYTTTGCFNFMIVNMWFYDKSHLSSKISIIFFIVSFLPDEEWFWHNGTILTSSWTPTDTVTSLISVSKENPFSFVINIPVWVCHATKLSLKALPSFHVIPFKSKFSGACWWKIW